MNRIAQCLCTAAMALAASGCATGPAGADATPRPTSNTVAGAAAVSAAGKDAIGAYGALGTSDDVRGRSGSSGATVLTGRANLAGSDSGASNDADADADAKAPPPR